MLTFLEFISEAKFDFFAKPTKNIHKALGLHTPPKQHPHHSTSTKPKPKKDKKPTLGLKIKPIPTIPKMIDKGISNLAKRGVSWLMGK